ncbi:MAG: bifunctional serine/threonine-protein kinase/formylglycine-generating enzyme family protein, partial [Gemmataceae bacterium]
MSETRPQALPGGTKLGEYILLDVIGAGGMGVVYRARHAFMNRVVALKTLHPQAVNQSALDRFEREVKLAAKVSHLNIVTAYDAGVQAGIHYLVMEYIDGTDLASLVKKQGPLPFARAIDYTLQTAEGLRYAHEIGLVHRDIKPHNLLLDKSGTIKILDLGLARLNTSLTGLSDQGAERSADLTRTGTVLGTFHFMAPEQARNTKLADQRADIYSLGCTLHYLLAGKPLFTGETLMEIFLAHQQDPVPSLAATGQGVPAAVDKIWQKMVAKQPEQRQQSIAEVIRDLRAALGPAPHAIARQPTTNRQAAPVKPVPVNSATEVLASPRLDVAAKEVGGRKPSRRWLAAGAIALLVLVGIVAFSGSEGRKEEKPAPKPPSDGLAESDTNHLGMRFKRIRAGSFRMGSSPADIERITRALGGAGNRGGNLDLETPAREVRIEQPFQMGVTEVTRGQFRAFVDATGYRTDAERFGTGYGLIDGGWAQRSEFSWRNLGTLPVTDEHPAVSISWNDGVAFCEWLT